MKYMGTGLISFSVLIGLAWYAFGGLALAVMLAAMLLVTLLLAAFGLGSWWSGWLMERGASIALKAQSGDNRRDRVQINALTGLVKETLKIRNGLSNGAHYPALPFGEETVEANFTIAGLDEEG